MVDAWHPAAETALAAAGSSDEAGVLAAAVWAAEAGAQATAALVARHGRAANSANGRAATSTPAPPRPR